MDDFKLSYKICRQNVKMSVKKVGSHMDIPRLFVCHPSTFLVILQLVSKVPTTPRLFFGRLLPVPCAVCLSYRWGLASPIYRTTRPSRCPTSTPPPCPPSTPQRRNLQRGDGSCTNVRKILRGRFCVITQTMTLLGSRKIQPTF